MTNNAEDSFKIEIKRGKGDKIHIYANGEYSATVDFTYWFSSGVPHGCILDGDEFCRLISSLEERRACNKALDILSLRDHSKKELLTKLKLKFSAGAAEKAVTKAEEAGLIDDEAFARKLSAELFRRKRYGPDRIKSELIFKGICREDADRFAAELDIDVTECIIELLRTKFSGSLSNEKDTRRTFNSLMRMGYRVGDIKSALRGFMQETEEI